MINRCEVKVQSSVRPFPAETAADMVRAAGEAGGRDGVREGYNRVFLLTELLDGNPRGPEGINHSVHPTCASSKTSGSLRLN